MLVTVAAAAAGCDRQPPEIETDAALFTRHYLEPVYQEDRPRPDELGRPVVLAAARGEREPASVALRTLVPLAGVTLQAGPLTGPAGATLTAERMDVRVTRYMEPLPRWPKLDDHPLHPGVLDPSHPIDLDAGTTQQFWITVHVPEDAPAGTYAGEWTVSAAAGLPHPLRLPVRLTVHPFELPDPELAAFLFGDNFPLSDESFANSRSHGMTTLCVNHGWPNLVVPDCSDGTCRYPDGFEPVHEVIEAARHHGLGVDRPICVMFYQHLVQSVPVGLAQAGWRPPDGKAALDYNFGYAHLYPRGVVLEDVFKQKGPYYPTPDPWAAPSTDYGERLFDAWVTSMRQLDEEAEAAGWPPLWYYLIDEPHHSRGALRLAMTMITAADAAGAASLVTCNEPSVSEPDEDELWFQAVEGEPALRLEPGLDVRCYANNYMGPETRERTREAGDVYGTYVNIYGNAPASVRHQAGVMAWKLDLEMMMFWQWKHASREYGETRSFFRDWEAAREGLDDLRYLEALEQAVAAGTGSNAARERARELLDALRAEIPASLRGVGRIDSVTGRWEPGDADWAPERYDALRGRVAAALTELAAEDPP